MGYLDFARARIEEQAGSIINASSIYRTASWGKEALPEYLNQVLEVNTPLSPLNLLDVLQSIENAAGRERLEKWGSRTLDVDVLFYDNEIITQPRLHVPHPLLHERRFTLMPLNELCPDFLHPGQQKTISQLLEALDDSLVVERIL